MKRKYYMHYDENSKINYVYLLKLYQIAKYNNASKLYDEICYTSIDNLANLIDMKRSTLYLFLNGDNKDYVIIDKKNKVITLKVDIRNSKKFIELEDKHIKFIIDNNDKLLAKYLIYHIYYCGFNKGSHDHTIEQMLSRMNYSTSSNSLVSTISTYNKLLTQANILKITRWNDKQNRKRNTYSIIK